MAGFGTRVRVAAKAAVGIFSEPAMRQAQGMLQGIFQGSLGTPPTRGTREHLRAYSQMPWVRAVAGRVASRCASVEWQLFVNQKAGQRAGRNRRAQRAKGMDRRKLLKELASKGELKQIDDHPLLDLVHDANSFQTGEAMRKVTQIHLDLVGEAFWLKERDGLGVPVGVWPVPPDWILSTPTPTNPNFRVSFRGWQGFIPSTEFIWFADPDPSNPYARGSGVAQALSDELETDEYAAKHTKGFFYNRARPEFLVYPKTGNMREPDVARLEEDWLSRNQGFWKAFRPYFLTREVGVHEFDQNFRAMQLVQLREFERNMVMQTWGIPPEIMGVLDNSNRATITAADLVFSRYVIEPRLEFQRGVLQERLVPEFDERLILEFVSPVQDDKDFALDVAKAAPFSLSVDEWRDMAGQPPVDGDGGDLYCVPTTSHLQKLEEYEPPPPPPAFGGRPGLPPGPGAPKPGQPALPAPAARALGPGAGAEWLGELAEALEASREAGDHKGVAYLSKAMSDDPEDLPPPSRAAARLEGELARAITQSWDAWEASVDAAALAAAIARGDSEDVLVAHLRTAPADTLLREAMEPRLTRGFMRGVSVGAGPLTQLGVEVRDYDGVVQKTGAIDSSSLTPEAIKWSREHTAELLDAGIRARQRIRRRVREALAEGVSPEELARELMQVVPLTEGQWASVTAFRRRLAEQGVTGDKLAARVARYVTSQRRQRALTIARTEMMAAINGGQQALWERAASLGLIDRTLMRRKWLVTWDELLEYGCEALADQTVALDEEFEPGLMVPPKHPRCRCSVGLVRARAGEV